MRRTVLIVLVALTTSMPAHATVLCQKKSKVVVREDACKPKEQPLVLDWSALAVPTGVQSAINVPTCSSSETLRWSGDAWRCEPSAQMLPPVCGDGEVLRWTGTEFACARVEFEQRRLDCRARSRVDTVQLGDASAYTMLSNACPDGTEVVGGGFQPKSALPEGFLWLASRKVLNEQLWQCGFSVHAPGQVIDVECQVICCTTGEWPAE